MALAPRPGRLPTIVVERRIAPACQPRTSAARSADATRTGGSPSRRGPTVERDRAADRPSRPPRRPRGSLNPPPIAEVADERLVGPRVAGRGRLDRAQVRVGEIARRGCSRGCRCRPGSGSRRRTASSARRASAAARTFGMRWVSGSWSSPSALGRAGDVEVPQGHAAEPVGRAVPARARPRTSASSRRTG